MSINILWDQQAPRGIELPVARMIEMILGRETRLLEHPFLIDGYNRDRDQHDAQKILDRLQDTFTRRYSINGPLLLVTSRDLYVTGCDFVFGLARSASSVAVVSTARLGNEYYGRRPDDADLIDRTAKEGAHELGHLLGLGHCDNPECVMFRPRTLDELDRKRKMLCPACKEALDS
ncbi:MULTISPECIES: archaemetzincin family Zn-dependent metalloprotease [Methanoculleus]|jgi:archaemetzincin|uniref:Archaemetzincin n=1 Tax=Methanoculleus thermophilus TaxID=2200 RepID=A0A1G8Y268_9EURY|nr:MULTISPECIES: archaemetzincin family Zn-dependent metalloprotease [Methanoculleus]NLN09287.1 archaemetzincin family Zn-dependent metalloprotease [Methanoculleus thermophilus]SDJ96215.1 archaemetzincin [Methanoculleus thermophilus]HQD24973.1 archaemetzincin family Zn-dependent metalloprotease [Methanoculleus thermophilus]